MSRFTWRDDLRPRLWHGAEELRCPCGRYFTVRGEAPCPHWPPPVEQTDPAARRVAWVLWCFAAVLVLGLIAYASAGCAPRVIPAPLRAKPPAYGHRIVSQ